MEESNGVTEKTREIMFNDSVHKHFTLKGKFLDVLDTPQFQRLRDIKQLGVAYRVFPGANHCRFSHSLGTCYLAQVALDHLNNQQPELEIEKYEGEAVRLAALCHDIGHGPFSHVLDNHIVPALVKDFDWHHEKRGIDVIDYLIDENQLELDKKIVDMAKDLIVCKLPEKNTIKYERRFLWDIVANGRNNVDVDKFDYLQRDSKYCNVQVSFDHKRIMNLMRVVEGEICFNFKEVEAVYELFAMRSKMHRVVYQQKCVKGIELMLSDAVRLANPVFRFDQMFVPDKVNEFCQLDDSILRMILRTNDSRLSESQAIIRRIDKRQLYKLANEFVIPPEKLKDFSQISARDILEYAPTSSGLTEDEIIVFNMKVDYGKGDKNPVDFVRFFDKNRPDEKFPIRAQKISAMLPRDFMDVTVRVYSKSADPKMMEAIKSATVSFQEKKLGVITQRTPQRTPQKRRREGESLLEARMGAAFGAMVRKERSH